MYPEQRPAAAERTRTFGKYAGEVLSLDQVADEALKRGQIPVRLPGILEEAPDGTDRPIEVLARPCFPPGTFLLPAEGDHVWVEFAAGDINIAIWTGVWYPDEAAPPTVDGDGPTPDQKVVRTPSGQVLQLEDTAGSERSVVRDEANDNTVTLDASGIHLEDANGNSITLDQNGISLADLNGNELTLDSNGLTLRSAGTAQVVVATASVKLTDGAGSLQRVVLEPLISQWLMSHQHLGNMGAPTPLMPPLIPLLQTTPTFTSGMS